VPGAIQGRTFRSAARAQLRHSQPERVGRSLPAKVDPLRNLSGFLRRAYRFRPAGDLATEIEWARNRRIPPNRYLVEVGERVPPIPPDLMAKVYRRYEEWKREHGWTDFEDLLELAIRLFEDDTGARTGLGARNRAF